MTKRFLIGLLAYGLICLGSSGLASAHDDNGRHAPPDFEQLDRYGEWGWEPAYGRVWMPFVEADWRPYWRGHWAWQGTWVWVAADPWGDGPFHYGEWAWSDRLGWVWIPGTVWAPARVTWIVSGSTVAWAPTHIHVSFGSDPRFWVYADRRTFQSPIVRPHRAHPQHVRVREGVTTRDLGRVFAPEHRSRERQSRPVMENHDFPNRSVDSDHRVLRPRPNSTVRVPSRDSERLGTTVRRQARGFEVKRR